MKVSVVKNRDKQLMNGIKAALINQWVHSKVNTQDVSKKFDELAEKESEQLKYAVMLNQRGQVVLVASLFLQYKFTRGLSQIYHMEVEYKNCTAQQELFFQSEIVTMIPGYKIIGLKVNESAVFKPHQTYMELNHHKIIPLKGAL